MIAAALSGIASGASLLPESFVYFHHIMHANELWILVLSATLVVVGGWMEVRARRVHRHGFPWLFALSVCCFLANAAIIFVHRAVG